MLTGIAFASQGSFVGMPYNRICFDKPEVTDWVFRGMEGNILGDFGFSGDGAAGYELDRIDPADFKIKDGEIVILAQAHTNMDKRFILVPEDGTQRSLTFLIVSITHVLLFFPKIKITIVLTPWTNQARTSNEDAMRADMIYFRVQRSGAQVFSVGSITFCGSLPYNSFNNNISALMRNVVAKFMEDRS
jgi:N,N-dimethylformamidase